MWVWRVVRGVGKVYGPTYQNQDLLPAVVLVYQKRNLEEVCFVLI